MEKTNAVKFEGGATRSHRALRYELIPEEGINRLALRMEHGAPIHGDENWKSGGQEFVRETKRHLLKHAISYIHGDTSDDHLGAILANASMLAHFEKHPPRDK